MAEIAHSRADAFFLIDHDGWFTPTEAARGPWDPHACHAGPPTGLLARASELAVPTQPLVRLTVDLIRPIPMAGFRIETVVTRSGRSASSTAMTLTDSEGRTATTATAIHLAAIEPNETIPTAPYPQPDFDEAVPGPFPVLSTAHGLPWFGDYVEVRYPPGEPTGVGPKRMWMKAPPLLAGEVPSPFQRLCPLADCGNAVSRNAEATDGFRFVNPDLTIAVHRAPHGDWIGTDSVSRWELNGLGISDSLLFDPAGSVGRAVQTLLIRVGDPLGA